MSDAPPPPAAATWLWYLELDQPRRALDASSTTGMLAAELRPHFSDVHLLRPNRNLLSQALAGAEALAGDSFAGAVGTPRKAPYRDGTFDCVAVHDILPSIDSDRGEMFETLDSIRRLLRPGGWFVGACPNASYLRHSRSDAPGLSPRKLARQLTAVGFAETRSLFVTPSVSWPAAIVPESRSAIRAYETYDAIQGSTKWARRMLARLGLGRTLYPGFFVLARA